MKRTVIFKKSIFVAFVLAVFSLPIFALEVPAWTGPVNDLAQVMTAQQRQELSDYLTNLNNQTGIQMAVLTVPSLEGDSIEDFSFRTASAWKLGQEKEDNGALLVVSVYWFEVLFEKGKDLFITLDTATGTLGRRQTEWFKAFLAEKREEFRHCVIFTHTNIFYTDNSQTGSGNMPFEESLSLIEFLGEQKVSVVLQGHDHYKEDLSYDNVRYAVLGTIRDEAKAPEYLKVKVDKDGLCLDWQLII